MNQVNQSSENTTTSHQEAILNKHIEVTKRRLLEVSDKQDLTHLVKNEIRKMITVAKSKVKNGVTKENIEEILQFIGSIFTNYSIDNNHTLPLLHDVEDFYSSSYEDMFIRLIKYRQFVGEGGSCVHLHLFVYKVLTEIFGDSVKLFLYRDATSPQHTQVILKFGEDYYSFDYWGNYGKSAYMKLFNFCTDEQFLGENRIFPDVSKYLSYVASYVPKVLSFSYKGMQLIFSKKQESIILKVKNKMTQELLIEETYSIKDFIIYENYDSVQNIIRSLLRKHMDGKNDNIIEDFIDGIGGVLGIKKKDFFFFLNSKNDSV